MTDPDHTEDGGEPELVDVDDADAAADEEALSDEVIYDLSSWSLGQRSELEAHLVANGVAHAWVGAELSVKVIDEALCDELVTAVDEERPPQLDDAADDLGEEIVYELDDWDEPRRELLVQRLRRADVPHDFEEDGALVVPVAWEALVEEILDEVEFPDALPVDDGAPTSAAAAGDDDDGEDDLADDDDSDDEDDPDDEDDDDGEPAPGEVLSELFLAADRLLHDTADGAGLDGLRAALDVVEDAGPPYGIEAPLWDRIGALTEELADALAEQDDEAAVARATELRTLLRPYV